MTKKQHTKPLQLTRSADKSAAAQLAEAALCPAVNAAMVSQAYQGSVLGDGVDVTELMNALQSSMSKSNSGNLSDLENMLIGQATALQTMFVSLARRAQRQEYQRHFEAFLGLALKAQAQSRATIQAVVDLKYPKQATFVNQANIANGPQQVNNGPCPARELKNQTQQIEVLDGVMHGCKAMDRSAKTTTERGDPGLGAMAAIDRPPNT